MGKYVAVILLIGISISNGTTIYVPTDQATIQDGIKAAASGDTVLVSSGIYIENLNLLGKTLHIEAVDGAYSTTIQPLDDTIPTITLESDEGVGTHIKGFTLAGGNGHTILEITSNSNLELSYCIIRDFTGYGSEYPGVGVAVKCRGGDQYIHHNIFINNVGYCISPYLANNFCEISNNTFYGNERGIYDNSSTIIKNNIITNCSGIGIWGAGGDYNVIYGNNPDYHQPWYVLDDWSFDPLFVDPLSENFSLRPESRCIDGGDPSPKYYDPDGSCTDIGAVWYSSTNYPTASRLRYAESVFDTVTASTEPTFYWDYFDTAFTTQAGIEIQVTEDSSWNSITMWDSGPIPTFDTSYQYAGSTLDKYTKYYARIRSSNGTSWGDWRYSIFYTISANALWVPIHFSTIEEAALVAEVGDTILLDSGTYSGAGFWELDSLGNADGIESIYGPEKTVIELDGHTFLYTGETYHIGPGQAVTGLTLRGGSIAINGRYTKAINCVFDNNEIGMTAKSNGEAKSTNCIFKNNIVAIQEEDSFNSRYEKCIFINNQVCSEHTWGENSSYFSNCIVGYNTYVAISNVELGPQSKSSIFYNNSFIGDMIWGIFRACNIVWPQVLEPSIYGTINIHVDPLFCDITLETTFTVAEISPCLPELNECGILMGNVEIGCGCCRYIGDVNSSGVFDISDLLYLVDYFFADPIGPAPQCPKEGDVNGSGLLDISDLLYLVDFFFADPIGPAPVPCR